MNFEKTKKAENFFEKVYMMMFLGLIISGVFAFLTSSSQTFVNIAARFFWLFAIVEIGLVIAISAGIKKISANIATTLFVVYSILNGITLSLILLVYTLSSIVTVFFLTAALFGLMAFYGYATKRDISSIGTLLFFGLIGIILAAIVNMFLKNSLFDLIISIIAIIIFLGLTAYDNQRLKKFAETAKFSGEIRRYVVVGALSLYLDFINLFINILRILGRRD